METILPTYKLSAEVRSLVQCNAMILVAARHASLVWQILAMTNAFSALLCYRDSAIQPRMLEDQYASVVVITN